MKKMYCSIKKIINDFEISLRSTIKIVSSSNVFRDAKQISFEAFSSIVKNKKVIQVVLSGFCFKCPSVYVYVCVCARNDL